MKINKYVIQIASVVLVLLALFYIYIYAPNFGLWMKDKFPSQESAITTQINDNYIIFLGFALNSKNEIEDVFIQAVDHDKLKIQIMDSIALPSSTDLDTATKYINEQYNLDIKSYIGYKPSYWEDYLSLATNSNLNSALTESINHNRYDYFYELNQRYYFSLTSSIVTNMTPSDYKKILDLQHNSKSLNIIKSNEYSKYGEPYIFLANSDIVNEKLRVEITNESDTPGLARNLGIKLLNMGINVSNISSKLVNSESTVIMASPEIINSHTLKKITDQFEVIPQIIQEKPSKYTSADILVVIANDKSK